MLQTGAGASDDARFVSDWFDLSIYVDADEADIERWYVERFFALRETAFNDETSFFRHFAALSDEQLEATARSIWASINGPTSARTSSRAAPGPIWSSPRARTTPSQQVRAALIVAVTDCREDGHA